MLMPSLRPRPSPPIVLRKRRLVDAGAAGQPPSAALRTRRTAESGGKLDLTAGGAALLILDACRRACTGKTAATRLRPDARTVARPRVAACRGERTQTRCPRRRGCRVFGLQRPELLRPLVPQANRSAAVARATHLTPCPAFPCTSTRCSSTTHRAAGKRCPPSARPYKKSASDWWPAVRFPDEQVNQTSAV